ncbi:MAG TPA: hypothetical protein VFU29_19405 [Chitinophagaceae bacterium]|nr:hypothetical protein [Chitinophagaceae bacterium]
MNTILVKELNVDRPAIISLKPRRESIDLLRGLIIFLYPFCKWFATYKKTHSSEYRWLSYL